MTDKDDPKPGTYGALERSLEPFPWRRMLEVFMLTPATLNAHLQCLIDERARETGTDGPRGRMM